METSFSSAGETPSQQTRRMPTRGQIRRAFASLGIDYERWNEGHFVLDLKDVVAEPTPEQREAEALLDGVLTTALNVRVDETEATMRRAGLRLRDVGRLKRRQVFQIAARRTRGAYDQTPLRRLGQVRPQGAGRPRARSARGAASSTSRGDPDDDGPGEARPIIHTLAALRRSELVAPTFARLSG
jgi:hypothetical protein